MRVLLQTPLNVTALAKRFGVARTTIQRLKKGWRECLVSDARTSEQSVIHFAIIALPPHCTCATMSSSSLRIARPPETLWNNRVEASFNLVTEICSCSSYETA
jgi:hypothetical protein